MATYERDPKRDPGRKASDMAMKRIRLERDALHSNSARQAARLGRV